MPKYTGQVLSYSLFSGKLAAKLGILCILLIFNLFATAQTSKSFVINQIEHTGNQKTKNYVLNRELTFQEGDTIQYVNEAIELSKQNLINTRLFHHVDIHYIEQNNLINIIINVQERWYLWPIPIFEYADPNLASWLRRKEIDYLNYGIILEERNFRGRKEMLRLKLRRGIREMYGVQYTFPQLANYRNLGGMFDVAYFQQKELHHKIIDKQYITLNTDRYIYFEQRFLASLLWRPGYYTRHAFYAGYRRFHYHNSIDSLFGETVRSTSEYLSLGYKFKYFRGDYVAYPLQGQKIQLTTESGLGKRSYAFVDMELSTHHKLHTRWTFSYGMNGFVSLTQNFPHFLYIGPGKTWYIRGFEDYAFHNDLLIINRLQLKYTLLKKRTIHVKQIASEKFNSPYFALYVNGFTEIGYGNNIIRESDEITPVSIGLGFDLLTYYDWIGRMEFVLNSENRAWFNIHWGYIF
ncbi:MAG: POTRA domain-containing protein [Salinivirgaceae bacterium]